MRRLLVVGAMVFAASVTNARATTITFEDVALDSLGAGGDRTSGGFLFDTAADHSHIDDGTGGWGTSDGTKFMMVDDIFGLDAITLSPIGGGPFTLSSIDISEANGITSSHRVRVTGTRFGGGTNPAPLTLTLDFFGPAPAPSVYGFQTFAFDSDWTDLSSVTLKGIDATCCGPGPGNYYAIDNVVVNSVPEPATLTLLGLGSGYLIRRRRSRR